jgi:hypothetical protein
MFSPGKGDKNGEETPFLVAYNRISQKLKKCVGKNTTCLSIYAFGLVSL